MSRPVVTARFDAFLAALAEGCTVTAAAKTAGLSWATAYARRKSDLAFDAAWRDAVEQGNDAIESEIYRCAVVGSERTIYYQGESIGAVREYSDTLLALLAKARMPSRYRERFDINQSIDLRIDHAAELIAARKRAVGQAQFDANADSGLKDKLPR